MLNISESKSHCQGTDISRRNFLSVGSLGVAGLTLADLLRLKAQGATEPKARTKSVIMIYLHGGPPHIDMYDLKPAAPPEYRGEFQPIRTNVPGLDICELMPRQATMADQFTIVRSLRTLNDGHLASELMTGATTAAELRSWPAIGSVVSRIRGLDGGLPPYVSLVGKGGIVPELFATFEGTPGYLGFAHRPFCPDDEAGKSLRVQGSLQELEDRKSLLQSLDRLRRDVVDANPEVLGHDAMTAKAFDLITSGKVRDALDVHWEPDKVRDRYGRFTTGLMARRLVEVGVPFVTLRGPWGTWDTHHENFKFCRETLPVYDHHLYTLLTDLRERGLSDDVLVVVWGEMGRKPKIGNGNSGPNGRDHWPQAGFVLFAGGGLQMGQVIGATDARAEQIVSRPYRVQNVLATIYHFLGIDPAGLLRDAEGRPQPLLHDPTRITELL